MAKILELSPGGRRYGAYRDIFDRRDFSLAAALSINLPLPPKTNNVQYRGPIKNQGTQGSCTAHGTTEEREFLARKFENDPIVLSPAFAYYMERELEGTLADGDCGAQVRTSVQVMNKYGCALLSEEPYVDTDFSTAPTPMQMQEALRYKGGAYHKIYLFADMKSCMASGYGFVLGFNVYDSFENDIGANGLMPVPNISKETLLGGHEVFALDYDDSIMCPGAVEKGAFLVQNSWGENWGYGGMFYMPYEVAANGQMLTSAWMQHLGPAWK